MRIIFHLIILCLVVLGCNNKPRMTAEEQRVEDSLRIVLTKQISQTLNSTRIKDSIAIAEQNKVIGDIRFGMSKEIADKKIEKFINQSKRKLFENSEVMAPFIGNYQFYGSRTFGIYNDDKLYFLSIQGETIPYKKLETKVREQLDYITEVITLKYGEPLLEKPFPKSYEIDEEKSYVSKIWVLGTKRIEIIIDEDGLYYTVDVFIYQPEVLDEISKKDREEELKDAEKAENTF